MKYLKQNYIKLPTNQKRNLPIFTLICIISLALTACFNPFGGAVTTGTIRIILPSSERAAAWPSENSDGILPYLQFNVKLTGPSGTQEHPLASGTSTAAFNVAVGTWEVIIEGWYDSFKFASGTAVVDVKAGESTYANVVMEQAFSVAKNRIFIVSNQTEWQEAVSGVSLNGGVNEIIIVKDFSMTVPSGNTFSNNIVKVTIHGNRTITLTGTGSLLQIASNHEIILKDVKLKGNDINTTSLINVQSGTLIMQGSASVHDNIDTSSIGGGGGVYITGGKLIMQDNSSIHGNKTETLGGGVYITGSNASIDMQDNSKIYNNTAQRGGGVYFNDSSGSTFVMQHNASITKNIYSEHGGGVYSINAGFTMFDNASITENYFTGNFTNMGGGGVYIVSGIFTMRGNSIISGNKSSAFGGGVYVSPTSFVMEDYAVVANNEGNFGGGVCLAEDASLIMNNKASIHNNKANVNGGGVGMMLGSSLQMKGETAIYSNEAGNLGGGVYLYGIFEMNETTSVHSNKAELGGGVYIENGTCQIRSGSMYGNTAGDEGATIYINNTASSELKHWEISSDDWVNMTFNTVNVNDGIIDDDIEVKNGVLSYY